MEAEHPSDHYYAEEPVSKQRLGVIRTYFRGQLFEFLTSSSVFSKTKVDRGTRLLIESMILPEQGSALDIGCGYGAVGIAAAMFNRNLQVAMTDVNRRAVWLAKQNVKRNGISNVTVYSGLLYTPLGDSKFDAILSNPPVSAGLQTVSAIVEKAPDYLNKKGVFQMVVRSKIGGRRLSDLMLKSFKNIQVLSRKGGYRVLLSESL